MKNTEIKALSTDDLAVQVVEAEKQLHSLKFSHAVTPIENPMIIRQQRRHVARLKAELHQRTLQQVAQKVTAGELTNFNAREFLAANNGKLPTPITLAKLKKIIGNAQA